MPTRFLGVTRWTIVVVGSVALGWALNRLHVPAAWILGAIIVSAAVSLSTSTELVVNRRFYAFARGMIGVIAGIPLMTVQTNTLLSFILPAIIVSILTVGIGFIGGWFLHRSEPSLNERTAVLSMLPGGASMMPVLADAVGADYRYVALSQYLRLVVVSITLPLVAGILPSPADAGMGLHPASTTTWWTFALVVIIALVGEPLARKVHLPAPPVVGPMLLAVVVDTFLPATYSLEPPAPLRIMAFLAIGWICGGGLTVPALRLFARQLPITLSMIAFMIATCAGVGWLLSLWLKVSYFEAYLATTPGALETVLALGSDGGAGAVVVVLQIVRLLAVVIFAGWLPRVFRSR